MKWPPETAVVFSGKALNTETVYQLHSDGSVTSLSTTGVTLPIRPANAAYLRRKLHELRQRERQAAVDGHVIHERVLSDSLTALLLDDGSVAVQGLVDGRHVMLTNLSENKESYTRSMLKQTLKKFTAEDLPPDQYDRYQACLDLLSGVKASTREDRRRAANYVKLINNLVRVRNGDKPIAD